MVKATKKPKKTVKPKKKKQVLTSNVLSTSDEFRAHADLHSSLSDSIFKDSFDKFLGDRG